jgi:hypothetical protein
MLAVLTGVPSPASAAVQHQDANLYAFWDFHGHTGFRNIDQRVQVTRKAHHTYWAMAFQFTATPGEGGYLGLQTNGHRFDGTTGETAVFSLWAADAVRGSRCGSFAGEGVGYSCRVAFRFDTATTYRYRVWRLDADADGQWWGAWIRNTRTGADTPIGAVRVAADKNLMTGPANFSEYWGNARSCDRVPRSTAFFTQPAANRLNGGGYEYGSVFGSWSRAACTGGRVTQVDLRGSAAARVVLGGHR